MGNPMGMNSAMGMNSPMGMNSAMGMGGEFSPMSMGGGSFGMGPNAGIQSGHAIRMQGIPFNATESDVAEWFSSVVDPVKVDIAHADDGRPSGNATAWFATLQDAKKAMTKNKENMQHRYVELFYEGDPMNSGAMGPVGLGISGPMGTEMGSTLGLGMSSGAGMGRGFGMGYGRGFGRGAPIGMGFGRMPGLGGY